MPPKPQELVNGIKYTLLSYQLVALQGFCDALSDHGGFPGRHDRFVVPALAVAVVLNQKVQQLVDAVPQVANASASAIRALAARRKTALGVNLVGFDQAVRQVFTSQQADAVIVEDRFTISLDAGGVLGTAEGSTYESLLESAHAATGAAKPEVKTPLQLYSCYISFYC
jgi:hypothetical protein